MLARTTRNSVGIERTPSESESFQTVVCRPCETPDELEPAEKIVSSKMMNSSGGTLSSTVVKKESTVSILPRR